MASPLGGWRRIHGRREAPGTKPGVLASWGFGFLAFRGQRAARGEAASAVRCADTGAPLRRSGTQDRAHAEDAPGLGPGLWDSQLLEHARDILLSCPD